MLNITGHDAVVTFEWINAQHAWITIRLPLSSEGPTVLMTMFLRDGVADDMRNAIEAWQQFRGIKASLGETEQQGNERRGSESTEARARVG